MTNLNEVIFDSDKVKLIQKQFQVSVRKIANLALNNDRSMSFTGLVVGSVCVVNIVNVTYVWNGIAHLAGSLYIKS